VTLPRLHVGAALLACAVLVAGGVSPAFAARPAGTKDSPVLSEIHAWTTDIYTRVAVYTGDEVSWRADNVAGDPAAGLPPRIFIDIQGADIRKDILHHPVDVRNGLLRRVRAGRYSKDTVRVVVDLERQSSYRVFALPDPFRIIIDVDGEAEIPVPTGEQATAAATPAGGTAPPAPAAAQPDAPQQRIRVMIDPGHGGKDPGAIGPTGLREKDVVLAIGQMVRDKLAKSGMYDVRMTRARDVFIPLEERTALANGSHADIFVSLHINASRNRQANGISTYVLSRGASNREDLELAARENGVPVSRLKGVKFIIDDMFTGARKNQSLRLAKTVNDAIYRKVSARYGGHENLGLKQAPFFVLVGARMTAVLVESSFISNPREERRLRDPAYLERIADGVVEAVRYYGQNGILARSDF
jgi:N-acetylmuramoyl-L-alanine amidase